MEHIFSIHHLISSYGYVGIFVIVFLESGIFFPLPGDSLLFTAGLLAPAFHLHIIFLILIIFIATFLGGIAGYEIGIHLHRLHKYKFFRSMLKKEYIDRAHRFFDKHGRSAIIISRFIPVVRTFTPIVAGIACMEYVSFIKYNFLSSILWSTIVTLLGFFLGRAFPGIKDYLPVMAVLVIFISILPGIVELYMKRRKS